MTERRPIIAWILDQPDWAYANRAHALSVRLPQYEHRMVVYSRVGFLPLLGADLIICPDPRLFHFFGHSKKIVLNLNAPKIFVGAT